MPAVSHASALELKKKGKKKKEKEKGLEKPRSLSVDFCHIIGSVAYSEHICTVSFEGAAFLQSHTVSIHRVE